jgi:hypothetical protein
MGKYSVRKRLGTDFSEGLRVYNVLLEAMEEDGAQADGKPFYKYKKGWHDGRVGKETGYEADQIERFRRNRGMVYNPKTYGPAAHQFQPYGTLQKSVTDLTARVDSFENALHEMMALARLHEARLQEQGRAISALDHSLAGLEDTVTKPNGAHAPK